MSIKHLLARRRPSPAMLVACCALFVALGGTSYAFAVGSIGSQEIRDNSVASIDVRNHSLKGNDIQEDSVGAGAIKEELLDTSKLDVSRLDASKLDASKLDASKLDAARLDLAQLPTVRNATAAETSEGFAHGARVRADGTALRTRGVIEVDRMETGSYGVFFDRNVSDCLVAATIVGPQRTPSETGEISAITSEVTGAAVFVTTADSDGTRADHNFNVIVSC